MLKYIVACIFICNLNSSIAQGGTGYNGTFKNFNMYAPPGTFNSGYLSTFNTQENTQGQRYLFDNWAHGTVVNSDGKTINNDSLLFNYDKMAKSLIATEDKKAIIEVNSKEVRSFRLSDGVTTHYFVSNDSLGVMNGFAEVLANGPRYRLYKINNTRFIKADFNTDGLMQSGNPYDEYIDEPVYYLKLTGKPASLISLKSKSIRDHFKTEGDKLYDFMAAHNNDEVDEQYLVRLVAYLNKM